MFPWMKEQITEAWNSRKNSRSARRHSLNNSSETSGGMQTPSTAAESFLINVISLEGVVTYVPVTMEFTIEKVKSIATEHFYGHDKSKSSSNYRLVHATHLKSLNDDKKLEDEEINESDELLLVEVRSNSEISAEDSLKGPTQEQITDATKNLEIQNPPKPAMNYDCPADFQNEIRKILVTLTQASAKILMYSPESLKIYEIIKEKLEVQLKPPNDPKAVKYLVDMGFSERKVLKALRLRKMNTSEALEWLLEHQDDPDEEDEIRLPSLDVLLNDEAGPSSSDSGTVKKVPNLVHVVNLLLDSFRQFRQLEFKPDASLVQSLEEMGFEKEKILETLKITGNNETNACAWLVGSRQPSLENFYEGMDTEGPIFGAIMNNPQIHLSLTNPKMLLAYLSMIETPTSTSLWMKDPEVSPVLTQIFKTYHAEKHAIHVNRYENS